MLRATSEIAAAISVTSAPLKPSSSASARPRCRAVTMSVAEFISVWDSVSMHRRSLGFQIEIGEAFLEIQRRPHPFQRQTQLHHRERHVRLYSHNHGFGPSQLEH